MEKVPIDETISNLDSKDINVHTTALQTIRQSLNDNEQVLDLLIEQHYLTLSENAMHAIISFANEDRAPKLFDSIQEEFKKHLSDNLEVTLRLLTGILSRRDSEPTWMYKIVGHALLDTILRQLLVEKSKDKLPLGLAFVSMLLPVAPARLRGYLEDLLGLLSHAIASFADKGVSWEYLQRLCFHYFVSLYTIYPVELVNWAQTLQQGSLTSRFIIKHGTSLKLNEAMLKPHQSGKSSKAFPLSGRESHDIIWDVSCYTEETDLLHESKMIADTYTSTVEATDTLDISWDSIDGPNRSVACQTASYSTSDTSMKVSDSLISTYLEKTLSSSTAILHNKRKNSHRFEHDAADVTASPIVIALEGELMLEKYLRFQHQRRNRRYLSHVRACQQEKELNKAYKAQITRLQEDLASAERQLHDLRERCATERVETQSQLQTLTEKLNDEMTTLRHKNHEVERSERDAVRKFEELEQKYADLNQGHLDLQSSHYNLKTKLKQMIVGQEYTDRLENKVKKLQNQVLVVNDLRSYQCDVINALKPLCYNSNILTECARETPDVTNLRTLADETQKKFENSEIEVRKQEAVKERLKEEIGLLKEKLQKQRDLTEKTTNLWEQKYSRLEATLRTYRNSHAALYQKTLRQKRDLENRSWSGSLRSY